MNDLLDLSWSDKPVPQPAQPTRSLGSTRQASPNSVFDNSLARLNIATPPLRGNTPQTAPPTRRSATPDAFSSLISLASNGASKTLSLAERQQQAERERQEKADREREQFTAHGSFWDNLGSSSKVNNHSILSPQPLHIAHPPSAPVQSTPSDIWDDDDTFLSGPSKPTATVPSDPFDFNAFNETMNAPAKPVPRDDLITNRKVRCNLTPANSSLHANSRIGPPPHLMSSVESSKWAFHLPKHDLPWPRLTLGSMSSPPWNPSSFMPKATISMSSMTYSRERKRDAGDAGRDRQGHPCSPDHRTRYVLLHQENMGNRRKRSWRRLPRLAAHFSKVRRVFGTRAKKRRSKCTKSRKGPVKLKQGARHRMGDRGGWRMERKADLGTVTRCQRDLARGSRRSPWFNRKPTC
jgi:hypothetical protein